MSYIKLIKILTSVLLLIASGLVISVTLVKNQTITHYELTLLIFFGLTTLLILSFPTSTSSLRVCLKFGPIAFAGLYLSTKTTSAAEDLNIQLIRLWDRLELSEHALPINASSHLQQLEKTLPMYAHLYEMIVALVLIHIIVNVLCNKGVVKIKDL